MQRHSDYTQDPWARLAGTARWLVVSTFGSVQLAERESARVRGLHTRVRGTADDGRAYSASDPVLLRWVHLAFTDAFLSAQKAVGHDLSGRFGRRWPDAYVADWARTAQALGAGDLPVSEAELAEALAAYRPELRPVPHELLSFLSAPPGLGRGEQLFYDGLSGAAAHVVSPTIAPLAGVPGRADHSLRARASLTRTRVQLRALEVALGPYSPSEEAARYRLGLGPAPVWVQ